MRINRLTKILAWIFILYTLHITLYTGAALCASSCLDSRRKPAPYEVLHGAPFQALSSTESALSGAIRIAGESLLHMKFYTERPFRRYPVHGAPFQALSSTESALSGAIQKAAQFIARIDEWLCPSVYAASKGNPPVAHWRFDEGGGGTAYDDTSNNNDGTLTAGAGGTNTSVGQMWTRQGKLGGALELDGTDDYVDIGTTVFTTGATTVSMWVKPNVSQLNSFGTFNAGGGGLIMYPSASGVTDAIMMGFRGSPEMATAANSITIGQWQFLTFVYDGGNKALASSYKIYKNGITQSIPNVIGTIGGTQTVGRIGSDQNAAYFSGLIDDVKIYNYARTADQILVDYNSSSAAHLGAGTDPNEGNPPIGYWKLDENTGTTAYDRSGSGYNGAITGATYVAGKYGLALNFNGTSNSVNIGTTVLNNRTTGTISMWINPRSAAANGGQPWLNSTLFSNDNIYLGIQILSSYKIRAYYWDTTASPKNIDSVNPVPLNSWSFITYSWDGSGSKVYINGSLETSSALTWANVHSGHVNQTNYLGSTNGGSYWFDGLIDDVKIYNYARTQAQIAYDYNKGKPVAQYKFDEGGGTISHNEYSLPSVTPHRYWRFIQTAVLVTHAPRTCELRWTDILGNVRTPDSYSHGGTFSYNEELWNTSFDGATNTADTGWITGNTGYITADFGASGCAMMKFEAYGSYAGGARGATWDIQYSDDNSNWVTIKTWNFQTTDNGGGLGAGNYAGWYGTTWHTHGTLVGDTKFVDGKIGKALQFDGTDDYVVSSVSGTSVTALSVGLWVKRNASATTDGILQWANGLSNTGPFVYLRDASGALTWYINSNYNLPGGTLTDGTWVYLVVTWDGTIWRSYKDGALVNSYTGGAADQVNATNFWLGNGYNGYWYGLIDDVRIYNYSRSADQILQDYNAGMVTHTASSTGMADPWGGALPIAHWKLDENTGIVAYDASGNGNNSAAWAGTPTWAQAKKGSGLSLDSESDGVFATVANLPSGSSARTITCWFKPTSFNDIVVGAICGYPYNGYGGATNQWFELKYSDAGDKKFGFHLYATHYLTTNTFEPNNWYHLAALYDGTNVKMYVNGNLEINQAVSLNTSLNPSGANFNIFGEINQSADYRRTGILDDVKVFNYAFTPAQVAWDYNKGKPVGYWRLDESSGTTCYDDSGNGNTGTATIGATGTQTTIAAARTNGATGKYGKCMSFDGTDDYVSVSSLTGIPQGNDIYTISAWIKPNAMGTEGIVGWGTWGTVNTVNAFRLHSGGLVNYWWGNDLTVSTADLSGAWHHVVALFDGTTRKIYVDGVLKGSDTPAGHNAILTDFRVGSTNGSEYFSGLIDDVRIYNYARTADQILQDYNQGLAAKMGE